MPDHRVVVRAKSEQDEQWVREVLEAGWGSTRMVDLGTERDAAALPAFVAEFSGRMAGLVTYTIEDGLCEIVTTNSLLPGRGIGTALVHAVMDTASAGGCSVVRTVMTDDNAHGIEFYESLGFGVKAVHEGSAAKARTERKPEAPAVGVGGRPVQDEVEMERPL